jgi:hypothetical protein
MLLQRSTTRVYHALLWFSEQTVPACSAKVYTREKKHIGSIWSRVTCLALPLAATQSLERRALGDSRSLRRLTVVIRNKQCKQINK